MFTVTSTRRPTPKSSSSSSVNLTPRDDLDFAQQQEAAAKHRAEIDAASNEVISKNNEKLWGNPESAAVAVKILLSEAQRRDLAACKDQHAAIRLNFGWRALKQELKELIFRKKSFPSGRGIRDIVDTFSIIGLWFPDLPSPALARRPQAVLSTYYSHCEGVDVRPYIQAMDAVARYDAGRPRHLSQHTIVDTSLSSSSISDEEKEHLHTLITGFPLARPSLTQNAPFVAQSRELRQLILLRVLGQNKFIPSPAAVEPIVAPAKKQIEQEQEQEEDLIDWSKLAVLDDDDDYQQQEEDQKKQQHFKNNNCRLSEEQQQQLLRPERKSQHPQQQRKQRQRRRRSNTHNNGRSAQVAPVVQLFM